MNSDEDVEKMLEMANMLYRLGRDRGRREGFRDGMLAVKHDLVDGMVTPSTN